jgi:protein-tyrosine-phosphatase
MKRVLFVCSGNTCRSPLAAGIFNKLARNERVRDVRAESAGTTAMDGMRATPQAVSVAAKDGVNLNRHRSRHISDAVIDSADLVLTMTGRQWYDVTGHTDRDSVLKLADIDPEGDGEDIEDPFGGSLEEYQKVYDHIMGILTRSMPVILDRVGTQRDNIR